MVTVSSTKGFTLIELLACMLVISIMLLLSLRNYSELKLDHYYFMNDYLECQSLAIKNRREQSYQRGIYFNSMGHINQARTVTIANHDIVVHLGNGYATIR